MVSHGCGQASHLAVSSFPPSVTLGSYPAEHGRTYYWRVDTIDPDGAVHTGDVWEFTVALLGDVNGDGMVSAVDAALAARYAAGLEQLTAEQLWAADVDGDGEVTSEDASLIAEYAAGLITEFPAER